MHIMPKLHPFGEIQGGWLIIDWTRMRNVSPRNSPRANEIGFRDSMNVRRKKKESIHNDLVLRRLVTYVKSTWTELSRSCGQTVRVALLKLARSLRDTCTNTLVRPIFPSTIVFAGLDFVKR